MATASGLGAGHPQKAVRLKQLPPLIGGPYRPPACRPGDWLDDAIVGRVQIADWSTAPLSWPTRRYRGSPSLLLTDELVRALKTESAKAIAAWWSVHHDAVRRWRRALKLPTKTPGQQRQKETVDARRRGKPAHPKTREALLRGAKKPKSPNWGRKANAWMNQAKSKPVDI